MGAVQTNARRILLPVVALGALLLLAAVLVTAVDAGGEAPPRIAVLARSDNPVDALAASSVAGQLGGIVLLTSTNSLNQPARDGLTDFGPELVIIAGGTAALSDAVKAAVEEMGYATRRVGGATREHTAAALAALPAEFGSLYVSVDAPSSRAQALVVSGIEPRLERADGVSAVRNIGPGIYCLTLAAGTNLADAVVHVTPEWGGSIGNDLAAYWQTREGARQCDTDELEVRTFSGGTASDTVDFTVSIP